MENLPTISKSIQVALFEYATIFGWRPRAFGARRNLIRHPDRLQIQYPDKMTRFSQPEAPCPHDQLQQEVLSAMGHTLLDTPKRIGLQSCKKNVQHRYPPVRLLEPGYLWTQCDNLLDPHKKDSILA